ncbi:MAG: hypothetical protein QXO20_06255 [Candidatus Bathyarchaeia archaeon]
MVKPFPANMAFGVCGLGSPRNFFISQIHLDELPAVTGATIYAPPPLLEELQEKRAFYLREEFGNRFVEFKGEWFQTQHAAFYQQPSGNLKLTYANSYCYVIEGFGYIDESVEGPQLLDKLRERGLTPLYHWQPRTHFNSGRTITHRDLPDGYLLDPRTWESYAPNVIPKCVPSVQDVFRNPGRHKGNPFAKFAP